MQSAVDSNTLSRLVVSCLDHLVKSYVLAFVQWPIHALSKARLPTD